ncbi:MAG TPA: hypothetical protein VMI54_17700 [Polyangiaceae bacterium]|nr:hypothetical protein [Polyangiaceae bacterium]
MSSNRRILAALVVLGATAYGASASAESGAEGPSAAAKDEKARFAEAVRLYKAGSFAAALPEFEALAAATGSPNAELYVGYCLNSLDRRADAHAAFERAARDAGSEERYAETRGAALREIAELGLRLGTLVVSPLETPEGLVVTVDGVALEPAAFGSHRVLEPGDHHVEARAPGRVPALYDVHVDGGETKTVTVFFPKHDAPPAPPPAPARDGARGGLRIGGFVAAGVGGVGLVTFAIGGLEAKSEHDRLAKECGTTPCVDAAHQREVDRGKSWQTVANAGLVVGAVGAAASVTLLYFGYRGAEASVALSPEPGGALLSGRGRF